MRPLSYIRNSARVFSYALASFPAFCVFWVLLSGGVETVGGKIICILLITVFQGLNGWLIFYDYDIWFDGRKNLFVLKQHGQTIYIDGKTPYQIKSCGFFLTYQFRFFKIVFNGTAYRFRAPEMKRKFRIFILDTESDAPDLAMVFHSRIEGARAASSPKEN